MADADEDVLPTHLSPSTSSTSQSNHRPNEPNRPPPRTYDSDHDSDTSDNEGATADFRFLHTTTSISKQGLPKRGEKDFEPNPTLSQKNTLDASRKAMHDALSTVRVHAAGKTHNVGIYVDWSRHDQAELWGNYRGLEEGVKGWKEWRRRVVVVHNFRGTYAKTVGRSDRRGWNWLLPEEALYLSERGSLDVRWPVDHDEKDMGDNDEEKETKLSRRAENMDDVEETEEEEDMERPPPIGEVPMSLQGAYASFMGKSGLTFERHLVYSGLKRSGYIVQRAPTWDDDDEEEEEEAAIQHDGSADLDDTTSSITSAPASQSPLSLIQRLLSYITTPRRGTSNPCLGPLLAPGLYRNYNDIFRSLALIPYHTTSTTTKSTSIRSDRHPLSRPNLFRISYLVYKPNTTYRKTSPPSPNFRVCVISARDPTTPVPTLTQISNLLDATPIDELKGDGKKTEQRIKHGKRSVLVAVVDGGVVSYLRFAEAEMGGYKIYEDKAKRAGKGGGRGRGGGGRGGKR